MRVCQIYPSDTTPVILVINWHKTSPANISLLENTNLWTSLKAPNSKTRLSQTDTTYTSLSLPLQPTCWCQCLIGSFRVLSDRVLFRILRDRVLFRVIYRALSDRVIFMVPSNRVLFRFLSVRVFFRVLLRVLSDSILCRVLSPRFLVCRVPSVASTTWGFCNGFLFYAFQ